MWGQSRGHSNLGLKGKDTLSSKIGKEGSWKYRNTKVKGLKLTQMTLGSTKKKQETTATTECNYRARGGRPG